MSVSVTDREGNYHIYAAATHWRIEEDQSLTVRQNRSEPNERGQNYNTLAAYAPGAWVCAESEASAEEGK